MCANGRKGADKSLPRRAQLVNDLLGLRLWVSPLGGFEMFKRLAIPTVLRKGHAEVLRLEITWICGNSGVRMLDCFPYAASLEQKHAPHVVGLRKLKRQAFRAASRSQPGREFSRVIHCC